MKTTVTKSALKDALDKLNSVPGCTHGAGDTVSVIAQKTSLRIVRATTLGFGDVTIASVGEVATAEVSFARLRQAVAGMTDDIELEFTKTELTIRGGGRVTLKCLTGESALTVMESVTKSTVQPVVIDGARMAKDFTDALRCADRKESREFFQCVHLVQSEGKQRVIGAATKSMASREVPESLGNASIPAEHADLLIAALPSCDMMSVLPNRVEVSGNDCRFSVAVLEVGENGYSCFTPMLARKPTESDPVFTINIAELQSAVRSASSFALDGYDGVDVRIDTEGGTAGVTTKNGESCDFKFTASCGQEIKFRALGAYLDSALKALPSETATIHLHDSFMLLCEDTDTCLIFMLMRTQPTNQK